jgi:hypothetical protein
MKVIISVILLSFCTLQTIAQSAIRDSLIAFPSAGLHFHGQLPLGDLANRFGPNYAIGGNFGYKTESNFIFDADFTYIFGSKVREKNFASNLITSDQFIINVEGNYSDAIINERGFYLTTGIGKIFSHKRWSPNPNSGIFTSINIGYLQHKIRIFDLARKTPQIENDYVKGYDRLSAGPCINLFLGYLLYSNSKLANCKIGFDLTYASTKSLRKFNYDTFQADVNRRNDLLVGLRIEWILTIYKATGKDFYYY